MLFNSYIFIFLFLPVCLIMWYGCNHFKQFRLAQILLIGMSLWFYGYFHVSYLLIILASCAVNYLLSFCLVKKASRSFGTKGVRLAGIVWNLGLLGIFKYYDFFVENMNAVFSTNFALRHIVLPLGISFFTFQQLSFILDRCRGEAPHYSLVDYLTFVTFFPQLIAGPIVLHSELIPQFHDEKKRSFQVEQFAKGIAYFSIGLAKKVVIADSLTGPVEYGFTYITGLDSLSAFLVALSFTLQLYFDFSGYCDMAVGLGKMFGLDLPQNFDSPYQSASVKEFWRRWHMTLGRFFTTYVYIPLGGNRKGKLRTVFHTMVVFLLSGFWHGAAWTFVFWGILHGIAVSFSNLFGKKEPLTGWKKRIHQLITFLYIMLAFVFFRADSLQDGFIFMRQLFTPCYSGRMFLVADYFDIAEGYLFTKMVSLKLPQYVSLSQFLVYILFLLICICLLRAKNTRQLVEQDSHRRGFPVAMACLFVWSVISLSGVSTFLYFNF